MIFNPQFPTFLNIPPVKRFEGQIRLPGSKSLSNRAFLLAALCKGETRLHHLLSSDDTRYMSEGLRALGVSIDLSDDSSEARVSGIGGKFPAKSADMFLGNSGTAMRSLCAAACLGNGKYRLSGEERMTERPISDLVDALTQMGAKIQYEVTEGYPPVRVMAAGLEGGDISVAGNISSQYLTALLISGPCCKKDLHITVKGELISKPYIQMTILTMEKFGVKVRNKDFKEFHIPVRAYKTPGDFDIEGDASSASYLLAGAAILGGPVRVLGLDSRSAQGDVKFAEVLQKMGAEISYGNGYIECRRDRSKPLRAVDMDLNDIPDAAMTLAVTALFAKGTTTIRNIGSWRVKETDRIAAISEELRKVGAHVETDMESIRITPPDVLRSATIETYNDHRMAMCFSLVALGGVEVKLMDPGCVKKTYPRFFEDFKALAR
jgi:3-phosphoshikimate 1-carboxyvinyltransferase